MFDTATLLKKERGKLTGQEKKFLLTEYIVNNLDLEPTIVTKEAPKISDFVILSQILATPSDMLDDARRSRLDRFYNVLEQHCSTRSYLTSQGHHRDAVPCGA